MPPFGLGLGLKLGNQAGGNALLPETKAYQTRVVADGGEILDIKQLNEDIKTLKAIGNGSLWAKFYQLLIAHGGLKLNQGDVQKWYDVISEKDVTQNATATARPTPVKVGDLWELQFDGNDWLSGVYGEEIAQPHTRILAVKSAITIGTLLDGYEATVGKRAAIIYRANSAIRINAGANLTSPDNVAVTPAVIIGVFNGATSVIYQNGVAIHSGNSGTNNVTGLNVNKDSTGASYTSCSQWFIVQLKSGQTMTAAEANGVGAWAKSRYNIDYTVR